MAPPQSTRSSVPWPKPCSLGFTVKQSCEWSSVPSLRCFEAQFPHLQSGRDNSAQRPAGSVHGVMDVRHFSWFLSLMVRVSGCYLVGEKIDFPRMLQTRTWSTDHVFSEKTIISEATTFCSLVCGCLLPAFIGRVFPRQSTYRAWSELTHCLCIGSTRP